MDSCLGGAIAQAWTSTVQGQAVVLTNLHNTESGRSSNGIVCLACMESFDASAICVSIRSTYYM